MFGVKVPTEGYVDAHIHIIPNVDDGAADLETALAMAKMAYEDGTRTMIATPHYHPNKGSCNHETMYELFLDFQNIAMKELPGLTLYYGREIYCDYDAVEELIQNSKQRDCISLICMSNSPYVLLEFDVNADYNYLLSQIQNVQMNGYWPILAHIERYECLVSHPERLEELKKMNIVLQVNALTVLGKSGRALQQFVIKAIRKELVDLVASDAHSVRTRNPKLRETARFLGRKCGKGVAERLMIHNPKCIIEGRYMEDVN